MRARRESDGLRRAFERAALGIGLAALAGCSSLLSGGYSEGETPASPDAQAEAEAAATPSDPDAGDADAPAVPFCESLAPAPRFCADFDGTDPIATGFTHTRRGEHGDALMAFDDLAVSPPSSVAMRGDESDCSYVDLGREVVGAATSFHAEHQLRLGARDGQFSQARLSEFNVAPPPGADGCWGFLEVSSEGVRLDYDPGESVALTRPLPPGVWTKVAIDYVQRPTGLGIMIHLDDKPALDAEIVVPGCTLGGRFRQGFGLWCVHGQPELRIDNVILDWK